jgi:hypothetical protein
MTRSPPAPDPKDAAHAKDAACDLKNVPDTPIAAVPDGCRSLEMRHARHHHRAQKKRVLPDLAEALAAQVPPGVVLDGEAVIWNGDTLDFDALQQNADLRHAALQAAGCQRIFTHHGVSGTRASRPVLEKCSSTYETETKSWSGSWVAPTSSYGDLATGATSFPPL